MSYRQHIPRFPYPSAVNQRFGFPWFPAGKPCSFYYFDPAKSSSMTFDAPFTGELTLLFSTFNGITGLPVEFADAVVTNAPVGAKTDSALYDGTGQQVSRAVSALADVIGPTFDGVLWAYALDGVWYYVNQGDQTSITQLISSDFIALVALDGQRLTTRDYL